MVPADVVSEQMRAKGVLFVGDGSDERHEVFLFLNFFENSKIKNWKFENFVTKKPL